MWQCVFYLLKVITLLLRTTGIFKDQSQHLVVEVLLKQHGIMIQQAEVLSGSFPTTELLKVSV